MVPMSSKMTSSWAVALVFLVAVGAGKPQSNQKQQQASILSSPVDEKTIIRFFYYPAGEYIRIPLVFRVVNESNPLFNTAPIREEGRTAYISLPEMRGLVRLLAGSRLRWKESQATEVLGLYKDLALQGIGLVSMDVRIVCSKGTAKAEISPKAICMNVKPLDAALKTPRALWEFQLFRLQYGCQIPGFKADAYPDHF
jgi:hypothetical protein